MDPFSPFEHFYVLDLEEQLIALEGMVARGQALGQPQVVDIATAAITQVHLARDLKARWHQAQQSPVDGRVLRALDNEIDLLTRATYDALAAAEINPMHPFGAQARTLRLRCFPDGLGAHSQATWTDQRALNRDVVATLQAPEHAAIVDALHLRLLVERLDTLSHDFAARMLLYTATQRADVEAAATAAAHDTRQVILQVLGMFHWRDPQAMTRMTDILTQLRLVYEQIHARYAGKKQTGSAKTPRRPAKQAGRKAGPPPAAPAT